jgi:hypothetical protein
VSSDVMRTHHVTRPSHIHRFCSGVNLDFSVETKNKWNYNFTPPVPLHGVIRKRFCVPKRPSFRDRRVSGQNVDATWKKRARVSTVTRKDVRGLAYFAMLVVAGGNKM